MRTPRRDSSAALLADARSRNGLLLAETPRAARSATVASSPIAVGELIAQLQRVWQRDIEKIVNILQQRPRFGSAHEPLPPQQRDGSVSSGCESRFLSSLTARYTPFHHGGDGSSESGTDTTASTPVSSTPRLGTHARPPDANVEALLNAMDALFRHRYQEVRTLAFEIVNLCIRNYGEKLTNPTRRRIFQQLEDHIASGDSEQLQKTLRLLTLDGRRVEPFQVEARVIRGDVDTCKRFFSFFHVLATHRLDHALGTSVCLRTLCWMVNADGLGTWSVMKHLLNSSAGSQVMRGLVTLLEYPKQYNQWILRGAVFFVGMSCLGSQDWTQ